LHGEVKVWYMTEKQRQEYIKKHPIRPIEPPKPFKVDYKWRGQKGVDSRYRNKRSNELI
jgi:hypothetical protein